MTGCSKADVFFSALHERERASTSGRSPCRKLSSDKDQELEWRGISAWISQPAMGRQFAIIDTAHPVDVGGHMGRFGKPKGNRRLDMSAVAEMR